MVASNLDDAPLMLMVQRLEGESIDSFLAHLHDQYDSRLDDADWGPRFRIGSTFLCRGKKFAGIKTFAGTLVIQVVFEKRNGKFDRPVIFRCSPDDRLTLLDADGSESEVEEAELTLSKD